MLTAIMMVEDRPALQVKKPTPSIPFIQKTCAEFFKVNFNSLTAFPGSGCDLIWSDQKVIDIVLFGDGLYSLLNSAEWPKSIDYRIWCLSPSFAELFHQFYSIPKSQISFIPRYRLMPISSNTLSLYNYCKDTELTFVYSGRILDSKNFILVAAVVAEIGKLSIHPVHFIICGPNAKAANVKKTLSLFKWKIAPKVLGDLGLNWTSHTFKNPILINLSTYRYEDFGVSSAQAQAAGWPLLVSNWGGNRDICGSNVLKIEHEYFPKNMKKLSDVRRSAAKIAGLFIDKLQAKSRENIVDKKITFKTPNKISHHELVKLQNSIPALRRQEILSFLEGKKQRSLLAKAYNNILWNFSIAGKPKKYD